MARISEIPKVKVKRSFHKLKEKHLTTFNKGDLIPFYWQETLPGDSFKITTKMLLRILSPIIKAPMDDLRLDTYYFFIPNRLVFDKWKNLQGETDQNPWPTKDKDDTDVEVPILKFLDKESGTNPKNDFFTTLSDYFGIPPSFSNQFLPNVTSLLHRMYALVWNRFFRDQNLQEKVNIDISGSDALNNSEAFGVDNIYGLPAKINKIRDYFTNCLPGQQKGIEVAVPIVSGIQGTKLAFPVLPATLESAPTSPPDLLPSDFTDNYSYVDEKGNSTKLLASVGQSWNPAYYTKTNTDVPNDNLFGLLASQLNTYDKGSVGSTGETIVPNNFYAFDTGSAIGSGFVNITDIRQAEALQKMFERDARGGTRYIEILESHFGVRSSDARLQNPEFLGGHTQEIYIDQVVQTSTSVGSNPDVNKGQQGNIAGYSLHHSSTGMVKSFEEHGVVMGLVAVRNKHMYQQGIERYFFKRKRTDFYMRDFAHISEQPVYTAEIFAYGDTAEFDPTTSVFGYQPIFEDYRLKRNRVSGILRSTFNQPLDNWHFGDFYGNAPVLSDEFIQEDKSNLDRALVFQSSNPATPQFILDAYTINKAIRPIVPYGVPRL